MLARRRHGGLLMRKLASFSTRDTGVDRRTQPHSSFAASLIGWTRRHRLGACIGILIAAAAAIAQQAYQGQTEWFDSVQQSMSEAMTQLAGLPSLPDQTRVDLMVGQPAHDASVGKVAGEAGVSGGAATYSIPIVVPPGRRGLQPELSLSYSSRAGNGIAGMGWSLSGLSSLHRCPSTLEQDGIIRPVMLDASDKLCLDGQRLVARSGTYGASGATYATEIDSFARITQLAAGLASTAAYFKVELKSGEILYYGGNPSAADASATVVAGGVTLPTSWLLERKQDRARQPGAVRLRQLRQWRSAAIGRLLHRIQRHRRQPQGRVHLRRAPGRCGRKRRFFQLSGRWPDVADAASDLCHDQGRNAGRSPVPPGLSNERRLPTQLAGERYRVRLHGRCGDMPPADDVRLAGRSASLSVQDSRPWCRPRRSCTGSRSLSRPAATRRLRR